METRTPFFLLKNREIITLILFIIGLSLLIVYGSKAIADASDRKYVDGWNNRPFMTEKTEEAKDAVPLTIKTPSAEIKPKAALPTPKKSVDTTDKIDESTSTARRRADSPNFFTGTDSSDKETDLVRSVRKLLNSFGL